MKQSLLKYEIDNFIVFKIGKLYSKIIKKCYIIFSMNDRTPIFVHKYKKWYMNKDEYNYITEKHKKLIATMIFGNITSYSSKELRLLYK